MMQPKDIFKIILLSLIYLFIIILYLFNDLNRNLFGIILDSFWLTGITLFYLIFVLKNTGFNLGSSYFRIRRFEYPAKIYQILGVKLFKRILQKYPLPFATRKIQLQGRSESALLKIEAEMKDAEITHAVGIVSNIILGVLFSMWRDRRFFFWLTLFNVILNLYPVFVQRYNRNRIRILKNHLNGEQKEPALKIKG